MGELTKKVVWSCLKSAKLMEKEQRRTFRTYIKLHKSIALDVWQIDKDVSQKHHPFPSTSDLARSAATPKNGKELSEMEKVERQAQLLC